MTTRRVAVRGVVAAICLAGCLSSAPAAATAAGGAVRHPTAHVQSQPADDLSVPHGSPRATHARALRGPAPAALLNAKHSAAARVSPEGASALAAPSAPLAPSGTVPITTVFSGLNQPGLGAVDNSEANQGSPSDSTGAIGPSHYIEFVNSKMAVYRRSDLGLVTQRDLDSFVGRAGQNVFDPQIQWDQQGGRWLYLALDVDSSGNNFFVFGWSKTSDPIRPERRVVPVAGVHGPGWLVPRGLPQARPRRLARDLREQLDLRQLVRDRARMDLRQAPGRDRRHVGPPPRSTDSAPSEARSRRRTATSR